MQHLRSIPVSDYIVTNKVYYIVTNKTDYIMVSNKDPDAPIFKVADYRVVDDFFQRVPAITREISRK